MNLYDHILNQLDLRFTSQGDSAWLFVVVKLLQAHDDDPTISPGTNPYRALLDKIEAVAGTEAAAVKRLRQFLFAKSNAFEAGRGR